MRHSNKERDNVAEPRPGSNTASPLLHDWLMLHLDMKRQLPLVCPKDNALNSSLYPTLSVWNTGQSSATETAFDNYRSTSMGRF